MQCAPNINAYEKEIVDNVLLEELVNRRHAPERPLLVVRLDCPVHFDHHLEHPCGELELLHPDVVPEIRLHRDVIFEHSR